MGKILSDQEDPRRRIRRDDLLSSTEMRAAITQRGTRKATPLEEERLALEIAERLFQREENKKLIKEAFKEQLKEWLGDCRGDILRMVEVLLFAAAMSILLYFMFRH